jgi:arabinose-5-phosphate isomerase
MKTRKPAEAAKETILLEAEAVRQLAALLSEDFTKLVELVLACKGRLIVSGIGKSAVIALKLAATLNSTGTPAAYLHAADAIHGDLGMILADDLVLIISKSGDTPEIKLLTQLIKNFGNPLIAMVGNLSSYLALQANLVLNTTVSQEACPNNLAPTSSTTAQLVMGDALAVALMEQRGFTSQDFARFHPGGALGKKLFLRVSDLYIQNEKPFVRPETPLKEVILEISRKRLGMTAVINEANVLVGIITDGDLRRMLEKTTLLADVRADQIMTPHPRTIDADAPALEALEQMRQKNITQLPVMKDAQYMGVIHLHDLIREGII